MLKLQGYFFEETFGHLIEVLESAQSCAHKLHVCLPNATFSVEFRNHMREVFYEGFPFDFLKLWRVEYSVWKNTVVELHAKAVLVLFFSSSAFYSRSMSWFVVCDPL